MTQWGPESEAAHLESTETPKWRRAAIRLVSTRNRRLGKPIAGQAASYRNEAALAEGALRASADARQASSARALAGISARAGGAGISAAVN